MRSTLLIITAFITTTSPFVVSGWMYPNSTTRTVGGTPVNPSNRYPWIASILNKEHIHLCSGSLVSPKVVLTTAYCASLADEVSLGKFNEDAEVFTVIDKWIHPSFSDNFSPVPTWDYGVIVLDRSSTYEPVQIGTGGLLQKLFYDNSNTNAIGWGESSNGDSTLLTTNLTLEDYKLCNDLFDYYDLVTNDMICAYSKTKESFPGDSGGPLIFTGNDGTDFLVGLFSWYQVSDDTENDGFYPGVYARADRFYNDIQFFICFVESDYDLDSCSLDQSSSVAPAASVVSSVAPTTTPPSCVDVPNWIDSYGDACDWFEQKVGVGDRCDLFGDTTSVNHDNFFTATVSCCTCGGGIQNAPTIVPSLSPTFTPAPSLSPSSIPSLSPSSTPSNTCYDLPGFLDVFGEDCSWYGESENGDDDFLYAANDQELSSLSRCDKFGLTPGTNSINNHRHSARIACCVCGGGSSRSYSLSSSPSPQSSDDESSATAYSSKLWGLVIVCCNMLALAIYGR